MVWIR